MADTMISDLPDGIINYIISLLPTEDAVRTSLLAKRWRYFWTFLTVFDLKRRRPDILDFPNGIHFHLLKTLNLSNVVFANENSAKQLFSQCLVLQELTLRDCWANIQKITIAISTLRILTIVHHDHATCTIKINAVNLISLSYTSYTVYPIVELLPVNLTSVVDAYIDFNISFEDPEYALYQPQCAIHLLSGLSSVKSLKISNYTLEPYPVVVKNATQRSFEGWRLLDKICRLVSEDWDIVVYHSYREANMGADALTTLGCMQEEGLVIHSRPPQSLSSMLLADRIGISTPRVIIL